MAIFKCKMCGGDLHLEEGVSVAECEYCGTQQTVPAADDEKKLTLFSRANRLRMGCEFDKAAGVYESIVADFPEEAEAYWGLVLCKYGIEYVDDPATGKKVPTCHRSSFDSVMDDPDLEQALENADPMARRLYREEAKAMEELRRGIIEVSGKEEPYDIFICYKETDDKGERTIDSVIAQDVYDALMDKGYRVFFSRITLEDKLGQEYEPYIFAALNSAKIMLVFGTDYEYYNAIWVKNEWSRFLKLMATDKEKHLIPCYKGIDAYDIPKEFARLQAQDMGKVGSVQDLLRGIEKIVHKVQPVYAQTVVTQMTGNNVAALLERGQMAIEDMEWQKADEFFEEALNQDAKNAVAYLGKYLVSKESTSLHSLASFYLKHTGPEEMEKLVFCGQQKEREQELVQTYAMPNYLPESKLSAMLDLQFVYKSGVAHRQEQLKHTEQWLEDRLLVRAKQYADADMKAKLDAFSQQVLAEVKARVTQAEEAEKINLQKVEQQYQDVLDKCEQEMKRLYHQAQEKRETDYQTAVKALYEAASDTDYRQVESLLVPLVGYKDATELQLCCKENAEQIERAKNRKMARTRTVLCGVVVAIIALGFAVCVLFNEVIVPSKNYKKAEESLLEGEVARAAMAFDEAGKWKDAPQRSRELWDSIAERDTIAAGTLHTVGTREDGSVVAVGENASGQCNVGAWRDITAVAAGNWHTVGLKEDGTVVAAGKNNDGECHTSNWRDVVAVTAGQLHTVGLKADGTVVATGSNYVGQCDVSDWRDIVAIAAGASHTIGLKADGKVVVEGKHYSGYFDTSGWENIVAVTSGWNHIVGLKSDGTVVSTGRDLYDQCDVSEWADIVAVTAGHGHTVGLKADGTVIAVGDNAYGQCDVSGWTNIVAVAAGYDHTIGLKADGYLVTVGRNAEKQREVSDWMGIRRPGR